MIKYLLFFVGLLGVLTGCASTYNYKTNTKPYTINGKTYYPMANANGFSETGSASWYGPDFHGKPTASGETYNKYAYTAAHKTLPFGTKVNVKNLDNGLSTTVVINDRGPFKSGRIIDLSYAAAKQISMIGAGTARVRINAVGSVNNSSDNVVAVSSDKMSATEKFYVQVGTYSVRDNASRAASNLSSMGYSQMTKKKGNNYVVMAGPYNNRTNAQIARDRLRKTYSGAFIVE